MFVFYFQQTTTNPGNKYPGLSWYSNQIKSNQIKSNQIKSNLFFINSSIIVLIKSLYLWLQSYGSWISGPYTPVGVFKLFFDAVCRLRSETLPISKDSSPSKKADLTVYLKFSQIGTHFWGFSTSKNKTKQKKLLILQVFHNFCEMGPSSKDFFDQNGTHV